MVSCFYCLLKKNVENHKLFKHLVISRSWFRGSSTDHKIKEIGAYQMKDAEHGLIVEKLAEKLKETVKAPEWAGFVKTGHGKQRPPARSDWWNIRSAAVLLSVQKLGPVGVSKLSVKYGTKKNRGVKPEMATPGSRNVLRKILQQLEQGRLIKQAEKGVHKGRIVTNEGNRLIIEASKEAKKGVGDK